MQSITLSQIMESLTKLPPDKLVVVYDFISYLTQKETGRVLREAVSDDKPVAVVLSMAEYERLVARRRRKAAFHNFARQLGQEVEKLGLTEEELMKDLKQTKREVFEEQYGRPA